MIVWVLQVAAALLVVGGAAQVGVDVEVLGVGQRSGVLNYDSPCTTDENCAQNETWQAPFPQCIDGSCTCPGYTCKAKVQFSVSQIFYCGECGSFGSICGSDVECLAKESTCANNFCACKYGSSSYGLCYVVVTDTSASPTNLALIAVLIFIIIFNRCLSSVSIQRRYRRLTRRCCSNNHEDEAICHIDEDGTHHNPRGNNKSPSYALGNHEFYASSDDPDLDWAIELSLLEVVRRSSVSNSIRSAASNSVRSVVSNSVRRTASNIQQPSDIQADEGPSLRSDIHENIHDTVADNTMSENDVNLQIIVSHKDDTEILCSDNDKHDINNGNVAGTSDNKATEEKNSTNFPSVANSLKADGSKLSEADGKNTASHLASPEVSAFDSVSERKTGSLNNDGDGGSNERLSHEADVTSVYRRCLPAV